MIIDWPEPLIRDLVARRAVIVVGSGVSRNSLSRDGKSRPPIWEELLRRALDRLGTRGTRHISSAINSKDYLHACEWLKEKLDDDWVEFLRSELSDPQFQKAEIHEHIFNLDQRIFLTPNFDNIFENFVQAITHGQALIKQFCDLDVHEFLRDSRQYVIKIHGSIQSPTQVIFTQRDYAEARVKHSAFYSALDACLLSHTFLFLGCGTSDPDISLILENHNFSFPYSMPHYFVSPDRMNDDMRTSLRQNRNLKVLTYDPVGNHKNLTEGIKELAAKLDHLRALPPN